MILLPYDRISAVRYAHIWAYGRNPAFYDYEKIGGDCTNFASQCALAASCVMNYTPNIGWYYPNDGDRSPSWTGVEYFYNFMVARIFTHNKTHCFNGYPRQILFRRCVYKHF